MGLGSGADRFHYALLYHLAYLGIFQESESLDEGDPVVLVHLGYEDVFLHLCFGGVGTGHCGDIEH